MLQSALAGRHPAHHIRAVSDRLLGVERAFLTGEALDHEAGFFIDEYAHFYLLALGEPFTVPPV
jgi:hypothetical protein